MSNKDTPLFLPDEPLFGLAIGYDSVRVMQVDANGKRPKVLGYGTVGFNPDAIKDRVIVKPHVIANALSQLFEHDLVGHITTRRVAVAIPTASTTIRYTSLPKLSPKKLHRAVRAELTHQRPAAASYMDFVITRANKKNTGIQIMTVRRAVADSYYTLTQMLGLEAMLIEPAIVSNTRALAHHLTTLGPSIIIEVNARTVDISMFDTTILAKVSIPTGGLALTQCISEALNVSLAEATVIKHRYGLGMSKKQLEIVRACQPTLQRIIEGIQKVIATHSEQPIGQIITCSQDIAVPGLNEYLTNALRIPARTYNPWQYVTTPHKLTAPPIHQGLPYVTAAGLSMIHPKELFT